MSAFGGKADMTVCGKSLSRSLLGAKRTFLWQVTWRHGSDSFDIEWWKLLDVRIISDKWG
jgi:hypothetical protein